MYPLVPKEYVEAVRKSLRKEIDGMSAAEKKSFLRGLIFSSSIFTSVQPLGEKEVAKGFLVAIEVMNFECLDVGGESLNA